MIGFILAAITYKKRILYKGDEQEWRQAAKDAVDGAATLVCTITDLLAKKNTMKYLDTLKRRLLSFPYDEKLAAIIGSLML